MTRTRVDELLEEMLGCAAADITRGRRGDALATLQAMASLLERTQGDTPRLEAGSAGGAAGAGGVARPDAAAWRRRLMSCADCGAPPGGLREVSCDCEG